MKFTKKKKIITSKGTLSQNHEELERKENWKGNNSLPNLSFKD